MSAPFALPRRTFAALLTISLAFATTAHAQGRGGPPAGPPPVSGMVNGKLGPVVRDGVMVPVIEFADTTQIIRQSLWVETTFDSDHDGKRDRVHVQVTRPGAAESTPNGVVLPVPLLVVARYGRRLKVIEHPVGPFNSGTVKEGSLRRPSAR